MMPGTLLGEKYRLTRQIGTGAMGVVWAAVNEPIGREVALKLILQSNDELRRRLLLEARACGALRQKNVVEVYDVGETVGGDPFLVMQLLSGETLAELLRRKRRLDPAQAAQIARDVALALVAAHGAGIIHRDLKPANIFLHEEADTDGTVLKTVKVLDFGVSKTMSPEVSDGLATITGMVGSPAYMSPEQAGRRHKLDHRADLWSLGVVLFEMLTGERPFHGEDGELAARILTDPIPLVSRFVRHVPPGLVAVVSRCMERDLAGRVQTAAELVELLKPHCEVREPPLSAPSPIVQGHVPTPPSLETPPSPPAIDDDNAATARLDPKVFLGLMRTVAAPPHAVVPAAAGERAAAGPVLQKTAELDQRQLVTASPAVAFKQTIRMGPDYALSSPAAPGAHQVVQAPPAAPSALGPREPAPDATSTMSPHLAPPPSGVDTRAATLGASRPWRSVGVVIGAMVAVSAMTTIVVIVRHAFSRSGGVVEAEASTVTTGPTETATQVTSAAATTSASTTASAIVNAPATATSASAAPASPPGPTASHRPSPPARPVKSPESTKSNNKPHSGGI